MNDTQSLALVDMKNPFPPGACLRVRSTAAQVACAAVLSLFAATPSRADDAATIATTVCVACHGADGNSVAPNFPKLAGQQPTYLEKQLSEFIGGKRKNEVMAAFLPNIKKDDIPGLAAYFAGQKSAPGSVEDKALAEAGKKLYVDGNTSTGVPACMGCHQPNGEGNERFPRLAGQHQIYTQQQMADFKNGVRVNDKGKVMRAVAERMSEQEMKAVSEYIAGL
jgi:cytochrome c553